MQFLLEINFCMCFTLNLSDECNQFPTHSTCEGADNKYSPPRDQKLEL